MSWSLFLQAMNIPLSARAHETLPQAAVTDLAQLLSAAVRLNLGPLLGGGAEEATCAVTPPPHPGSAREREEREERAERAFQAVGRVGKSPRPTSN